MEMVLEISLTLVNVSIMAKVVSVAFGLFNIIANRNQLIYPQEVQNDLIQEEVHHVL